MEVIHLIKKQSGQSQMKKIAVIGLGYVGLPLLCFQNFTTTGYDVNSTLIKYLKKY